MSFSSFFCRSCSVGDGLGVLGYSFVRSWLLVVLALSSFLLVWRSCSSVVLARSSFLRPRRSCCLVVPACSSFGSFLCQGRAVSAECPNSVMNSSWLAQWSVRPRARLLRSRAGCAPQRGVGLSRPDKERPPYVPGCLRYVQVLGPSPAAAASAR